MRHTAMALILMVSAAESAGQWSTTGNTATNPTTNYLGTTDANALVLRTNALQRFRLNNTITYPNVNGFLNVNADGNLLITPNNNYISTGGVGPLTRLHLADGVSGDNLTSVGYRAKMKNGITMTGNRDALYFGQWYNSSDYTDAVIVISDNTGTDITDRMRVLFTTSYNSGATSGHTSAEGMEAMRIWAKDGASANTGLGDFYAGNLVNSAYITDPTERLDILNGRMRVRDLPGNTANNSLTKVLVVDDTAIPGSERGVINMA